MSEIKIPEGYKQTEVGVIPEDWRIATIEDIAIFRNGVAHEKFIDANGKYIAVNSKFISTEAKVIKRTKVLRNPAYKNEILMVMSDVPNGRAIAKCFLVPDNSVYSINQRICALNITKDNPKYIFYQLNRNPYYLAFDDGVKQTNLRRQDVLDCPLMIPPKQEQTAIATALSDVDNLIGSLEKLIAKKEAIKTGTMQQLLTGKTRLPEFATCEDGSPKGFKQTELCWIPEDWELTNIRDISLVPSQNGLFYEPIRKGSGVPLINVGDMYKSAPIDVDQLELFNATPSEVAVFQVTAGDLLFTRSSIVPSGIAYCNIFESERDDVVFDSHLIKVRPNRKIINPRFLYLNCISKHARTSLIAEAKSAIMTTIDQSAINRCPVLLPSKPEQTAIATIFSDMDAEIQALQQRLEKTKELKQGMMQQLLTGKVRLAH